MSGVVATARWRRLDVPGHDICRLVEEHEGWRIEGTAAFGEGAGAALLDYVVDCDASWRTRRGAVRGRLGGKQVHLHVERTAEGGWMLDGRVRPGLEAYVDLDLAFTPATNLLQLRRIALAVGEGADVPVAWLDPEQGIFGPLPQRYERRAESAYWYESPSAGYRAMLEMGEAGFVRRYPGLWQAEG